MDAGMNWLVGLALALPTIKTALDIANSVKKSTREIPAPAETYVRKDVFIERTIHTDGRFDALEARIEHRDAQHHSEIVGIHKRVDEILRAVSRVEGRTTS